MDISRVVAVHSGLPGPLLDRIGTTEPGTTESANSAGQQSGEILSCQAGVVGGCGMTSVIPIHLDHTLLFFLTLSFFIIYCGESFPPVIHN